MLYVGVCAFIAQISGGFVIQVTTNPGENNIITTAADRHDFLLLHNTRRTRSLSAKTAIAAFFLIINIFTILQWLGQVGAGRGENRRETNKIRLRGQIEKNMKIRTGHTLLRYEYLRTGVNVSTRTRDADLIQQHVSVVRENEARSRLVDRSYVVQDRTQKFGVPKQQKYTALIQEKINSEGLLFRLEFKLEVLKFIAYSQFLNLLTTLNKELYLNF